MTSRSEIAARLAAATPGPWVTERPGMDEETGFRRGVIVAATGRGQAVYADPPGGTFPENDRRLIAHAPTDLAFLLREIAELEAKVAGLEKLLRHGIGLVGNADCPPEAFGVGGGEYEGSTRWYLRDEWLTNARAALTGTSDTGDAG